MISFVNTIRRGIGKSNSSSGNKKNRVGETVAMIL